MFRRPYLVPQPDLCMCLAAVDAVNKMLLTFPLKEARAALLQSFAHQVRAHRKAPLVTQFNSTKAAIDVNSPELIAYIQACLMSRLISVTPVPMVLCLWPSTLDTFASHPCPSPHTAPPPPSK